MLTVPKSADSVKSQLILTLCVYVCVILQTARRIYKEMKRGKTGSDIFVEGKVGKS